MTSSSSDSSDFERYFVDDDRVWQPIESEPVTLHQDEVQRAQKARRARQIRFLSSAAVLVVACSYAWSLRDDIEYAFRGPSEPLAMGDVQSRVPADLPLNAFVEVEGIVEPRALQNSLRRGLRWGAETYWFFRLAGSGGVYIETPADHERFGTQSQGGTTILRRLKIRGRVIDPTQSTVYQHVLSAYAQRFLQRPQTGTTRMIQVDYVPGVGRGRYIGLLVFILGLICFKVWHFRAFFLSKRSV